MAMKITPYADSTFIIPNQPKTIKYLYNEMNTLVKKEHTPAIFGRDTIEISTALKSQEENVLNKLKELGAKFTLTNNF